MARHRRHAGLLGILDASNTNPMCTHCERRTFAIDETRTACRTCGEIHVVESRAVNVFARSFGARPVLVD